MTEDAFFTPGKGDMQPLLAIMERLRDPQKGCPWDVDQNFASIALYTIEEAYEVADAIEQHDWHGLKDELGDLLLQVVFHSQMAQEAGYFCFADVVDAIAQKMIDRHPHVFAAAKGRSTDQQLQEWENAKERERAAKGGAATLDGIALGLPAMTRALKIQGRMARVGFDWPDAKPVVDKIAEEAAELVEARAAFGPDAAVEEEFGDLLFTLVNLARHLDIDPEAALRKANGKVINRFARVEELARSTGHAVAELHLASLEALWQQAKNDVTGRE